MRRLALAASFLLCACGSNDNDLQPAPVQDAGTDSSSEAQADAAEAEAPEPACGTGAAALPAGLVELTWDDGKAKTNLRAQDFKVTIDSQEYVLNEEALYEAIRFDLEAPAKVYGFAVQWAGIPEGAAPTTELLAGLYPDFGYNGFDFWAPDPYWTGSRCVKDLKDGELITYVFEEPIELTHPGLVYVAHRAEPGQPVFWFDGSTQGAGDCAKFDECHSALNLPNAGSYYNGTSFPLQYDFMVRLYVEYTDQLKPEQRIFQPRDFAEKGHVSFGDYNEDGFDDLITDGPTLYRNKGDGTFEDVTAASGIAALGVSASGGVWGDYDNDGCMDLFLYVESPTAADSLLHANCDGTFSDATGAAGIVDNQTYNACDDAATNTKSPTAAAAWVDLDADGLLDLYQANFICWSKETYYLDTIWHNDGGGKFSDWTSGHGFSNKKLAGRGASGIDADLDGDIDVLVNNYRLHPNFFFENQGGGMFEEKGAVTGLAGVKKGINYYGHTIGVAWGDLDNDGDFDLIEANLAHPRFFDISDKTMVMMRQGDGTYLDLAGTWEKPLSAAGLRYSETHSVPTLADFDNDGDLDLAITAVYDGRPTDFYWGKGDGTFVLDAYHAGITTKNGWGMAAADIDNDGDQDLFAHRPFVNTMAAGPAHWLQVRVVGNVASNRAAIGSTVWVKAGAVTRLRHVQGGTGQGNQDTMYLHFGLGAATSADSISVTFPGGKKVDFAGPFEADKRVWVYEDGTSHVGVKP